MLHLPKETWKIKPHQDINYLGRMHDFRDGVSDTDPIGEFGSIPHKNV